MTISKAFPRLAKMAARQEKRIERFQTESAKMFHPYAVELCKRIKRDIPEFEGCELAMRHLYLEPRDLQIKVVSPEGEEQTERLANIIDGGYADEEGRGVCHWKLVLPERCKQAMRELDELSNYIDDNYSNVNELYVTAKDLK